MLEEVLLSRGTQQQMTCKDQASSFTLGLVHLAL